MDARWRFNPESSVERTVSCSLILKIREGEISMHWIYLILAIGFEVAGTTCMKLAQGFTKILPSIMMGIFYVASLSFLTISLKKIDVSLAYAIWSGLGTAIIAIIGVFLFKESLTAAKITGIIFIILGVVLLNLYGEAH